MGLMRSINIPMNVSHRFSEKGQFEKTSTIEIFKHPFEFAPIIFVGLFYSSSKKSDCCLNVSTKSGEEKKLGCSVMEAPGLFFW
jgi:hypothetical protein